MLKAIFFALFFFSVKSYATFQPWESYKQETILELPQIPGWCSKEKAEMLMDMIYEVRPKLCIEIGAFGGSTTYPIARALQYTRQGMLYAIDAWDNQVAIEGFEKNNENIFWWSSVDMKAIFSQFVALLSNKQLTNICRPLPVSSEKAVSLFSDESVHFLYIDGNFSAPGAMQDVILYFPKVKKGGYIWLNDADCEAKNTAIAFLMENCEWLKKKSLGKSCIVFKK